VILPTVSSILAVADSDGGVHTVAFGHAVAGIPALAGDQRSMHLFMHNPKKIVYVVVVCL
jgi:hypothetical protein